MEDSGRAKILLELEADLIENGHAIRQRDPTEHPALWAKVAKRLWFKVQAWSEFKSA